MLIGHSKDSKSTWFAESAIWFEDTEGQFNNFEKDSNNDGSIKNYNNFSKNLFKNFTGFVKRSALFKGGSKVKTFAKLPFPLAQTKLLLIPGIQLKFLLKRASDKFVVCTNTPEKNMKYVFSIFKDVSFSILYYF